MPLLFFTRETTFVTICTCLLTCAPKTLWKGVFSKRKAFASKGTFGIDPISIGQNLVCVWWGRGWTTSYIWGLPLYGWHSTDVHAKFPPFSVLRYMISHPTTPPHPHPHPHPHSLLFFSTKSIWLNQFFLICIWKAPLFWHPSICVYFLLRDFRGCLFSWYSMNWLIIF